jgi:hypothetical protein
MASQFGGNLDAVVYSQQGGQLIQLYAMTTGRDGSSGRRDSGGERAAPNFVVS